MSAARSRLSSLASSETAVLAIICLGVFSTALDQTVVVAALPSVMVDLEIPLTDLDTASWIVTAYLISYTVAMPLAGRLSDVYGRVRMFPSGAGAVLHRLRAGGGRARFSLGRVRQGCSRPSAAGPPSPSGWPWPSPPSRPNGEELPWAWWPPQPRPVPSSGPLYGGGIIEWLGWRWIFWLDIPQSFILIGLLAILPNVANRTAKMDYLGALTLGGALTVLSLGLSQRSIFSMESFVPYLMVGLGVFLVFVLIVVERRAVQPLLASFLYQSKAFVSANIAQFLVGVALIISLVSVPLMASTVMEKGAWESALHLVRLTAAIPIGAVVGGYIMRWTGVRPVCITGLAFMGAGLLIMSSWGTVVEEPRLSFPLAVAGLGFGLVIPPISVSALSAAPSHYWGAARLAGHRVADGGHGLGAGRALGLGHRAVLQPGPPT